MKSKLLILGARSFSADVADWASDIPEIEVAGFIENEDKSLCNQPFEGLPVYWIDELEKLVDDHVAVCGLSTTQRFQYIEQVAQRGMRFATLVHPSSSVSARAELGTGTMVGRGVIIAGHTRLGEHVNLNRGASVGHHTRIGDFCTLQPSATVAGACNLGNSVYIGVGATVVDSVDIGEGTFVTGGSLVHKSLPAHVKARGNPVEITDQDIRSR